MMLDGLGETQQTQQFPLYDLELSDDGSSLLISEPEKRQVSCPGRRRTSGIRQRQGSSASSTQVPPSVASNGLQRAHS
ncbi:unnamed protein product, partial [Wuchereria bancrofti]